MPNPKTAFRNPNDHVVGAVIVDPRGAEKGIAVRPHEVVWLTEEEQRLTAHSPRKAEDNPFVNGSLVRDDEERPVGENRPIPADKLSSPQATAQGAQAARDGSTVEVTEPTGEQNKRASVEARMQAQGERPDGGDDADPLAPQNQPGSQGLPTPPPITPAQTPDSPPPPALPETPPAAEPEPEPETPPETPETLAGVPPQEVVGTPEAQQTPEETAAQADDERRDEHTASEVVGTPEAREADDKQE